MSDLKEFDEVLKLFEKCSSFFLALGDSIRQSLFIEIARTGIAGIDVSSLTKTTHLSRPAVSHHLKVLKDSGILVSFKKGTQVFYRLKIEGKIEDLKNLISKVEVLMKEMMSENL